MNARMILAGALAGLAAVAGAAAAEDELGAKLERVYGQWRQAMVTRDAAAWQQLTAEYRRMEVRNRLASEKRPFPAAVFEVPAVPPPLKGLRLVQAKQVGRTARAVWFGKIDFGVGGQPTDNLLLLSFVAEGSAWKYDTADFISLAALPEVRKELAAGDDKYVKETKDFQPSGVVPAVAAPLPQAKWIAKVYVFCPGRDVQVQVNKISRHRFADTKAAEVVLGGAKEGLNEVQYAVKRLEGSTGKEAMTVRVYVMSETPGVKPVKAFEYQVNEGQKSKDFGSGNFVIDPAMIARLRGKSAP
jgi:hypothetical protein